MNGRLQLWFDRLRPHPYSRQPRLVLLNGLAEQAETWFLNHRFWRQYFDVHLPNLLAYDGQSLQQRIADDLPISVGYLVEELHEYLHRFVQSPPYHLVASSLGGKIAIDYAVRYPEEVDRLVLLCSSGLGDEEQLPVVEGVRRNDLRALVDSVFHDARHAEPDVVRYYEKQFTNRRWRLGLLRTIRGTMDHCVRDRLPYVTQPTLLITGQNDRIVSPAHAEQAASKLPRGQFLAIPNCGHAPHLEKARYVNSVVVRFLRGEPAIRPSRLQLLTQAKPNSIL